MSPVDKLQCRPLWCCFLYYPFWPIFGRWGFEVRLTSFCGVEMESLPLKKSSFVAFFLKLTLIKVPHSKLLFLKWGSHNTRIRLARVSHEIRSFDIVLINLYNVLHH